MKNILCIIVGFIIGIIATVFVFRTFLIPGIVDDMSVMAIRGANGAYELGYTDGFYGTCSIDGLFDDETIEWANNYEYKFIK